MVSRFLIGFIIVISVLSISTGVNSEHLKNASYPQNLSRKLLEKFFAKLIDDYKDNMENVYLKNQTNSSNPCFESFFSMDKKTLTTVIDSMFKPVAGVLEGNVAWLGNYRECMKQDGLHFCTIGNVAINGSLPLTVGLCVPDKCSTDDILDLLNLLSNVTSTQKFSLFKILKGGAQAFGGNGASMNNQICYSKGPIKYSNGAIVMLVITGLILVLCLLGTITELVDRNINHENMNYTVMLNVTENESQDKNEQITANHHLNVDKSDGLKEEKNTDISMHQVTLIQKHSPMLNFLLCFSVLKNTKAILDTSVPKGSITSLNGMRTLSITWVILGHCLAFSIQFLDDTAYVFSWIPRFSMQAIINATVSVDSFFFLSGLLVAYLSMKRFDAKGKLPLLRYYVHRYFRLTPSYAYLLFLYAYLFPIMGKGPYWYVMGPGNPQSENCISYWWTNLLYINNLYPEINKVCFGWSWYLANDMQFYVISPIILYLMYKFRWIGLISANGFLLVVCFLCNALLIYYYNLMPVFGARGLFADKATAKHVTDYQSYVYFKPYTRISPYLVGLILGYIMSKKYEITGKHSMKLFTLGWSCAIATALAIIYGPYSMNQYDWGMAEFVTYGTFFRFAWAVAIGWVLYACHYGKGGIVDSILSWKAFIPLSRLTYAVYLIHPMVLWYYFGVTNVPTDFTVLFYIYYFVSCTAISFMLAFVVAVCIEYPVFNLEKFITK